MSGIRSSGSRADSSLSVGSPRPAVGARLSTTTGSSLGPSSLGEHDPIGVDEKAPLADLPDHDRPALRQPDPDRVGQRDLDRGVGDGGERPEPIRHPVGREPEQVRAAGYGELLADGRLRGEARPDELEAAIAECRTRARPVQRQAGQDDPEKGQRTGPVEPGRGPADARGPAGPAGRPADRGGRAGPPPGAHRGRSATVRRRRTARAWRSSASWTIRSATDPNV